MRIATGEGEYDHEGVNFSGLRIGGTRPRPRKGCSGHEPSSVLLIIMAFQKSEKGRYICRYVLRMYSVVRKVKDSRQSSLHHELHMNLAVIYICNFFPVPIR